MKNYKITFVLPGISLKHPGGGFDVVYRLANSLNINGINCAIIFGSWKNFYVPNYYLKDLFSSKLKFIRKVFNVIFYGKRLTYIYHHWGFISKLLFNIDYDYNILKNTDCYCYEKIDDIRFNTDVIVATAWETAYFVNEYIKRNNSSPYYLIQHSEDDQSFSGKNFLNAKRTYNFSFKKIVTNKKVFERFKNNNPIFFHDGFDTNFYKVVNSTESRDSIMFPLRYNESKGSKYALECMEKLLTNANIKIIAFGDYREEEIPEIMRNRIDYYYKPQRKTLLRLYNKSKIFVLPSIVEGMSLPTLEAMSCGCAVIVTDNGGVNEYIEDNVNGLMCPLRDSDCLYNKIKFLLNNANKIEELAKKGLETAKNYSYENMENSFIKIIRNELYNNNPVSNT